MEVSLCRRFNCKPDVWIITIHVSFLPSLLFMWSVLLFWAEKRLGVLGHILRGYFRQLDLKRGSICNSNAKCRRLPVRNCRRPKVSCSKYLFEAFARHLPAVCCFRAWGPPAWNLCVSFVCFASKLLSHPGGGQEATFVCMQNGWRSFSLYLLAKAVLQTTVLTLLHTHRSWPYTFLA